MLPPPPQPCTPLPPAPWKTLVPGLTEFAKICVTHACMPMWSMCQIYLCANMVYIPKCLHVSVIYMSICQKHAYFSFLWANLPCGLPTSPANIANFVSIFQRDDANVPKGMTIFQAFLQNAKGNFYTLSYKNILYNT